MFMMNKKRLIVLGVFLIAIFGMTMYAGTRAQNETIATRTVKFLDGNNNKEISSQKIEVGKEAQVPEIPKYENQVFLGWFDSNDNKITNFASITNDMILTAKYGADINKNGIADTNDTYYVVTFYDTVSKTNIDTDRVLTGMNANSPRVPTHENYSFLHWSRTFNNVTGNITVNAMFNARPIERTVVVAPTKYHVVFFDGKTNSTLKEEDVEQGSTVTIPTNETYEKTIFLGWFDNNGKEFKDSTTITNHTTVTAIYAADINNNGKADADEDKYTIIFTTNGNGTLEGDTTKFENILDGLDFYSYIEIPTPIAADGYTSMGWDETLPVEGAKITRNATYTAIFKDDIEPYPVFTNDGTDWTNNRINYSASIIEEGSGIKIAKTKWSKTEPKIKEFVPNFTTNFKTPNGTNGEYYLWVYLEDYAGNALITPSKVFKLDVEKPTIQFKNVAEFNPTSFDVIAEDQLSGINRIDFSLWTNNNKTQLGVWGDSYPGKKTELNNITEYKSNSTSKFELFSKLPDGEYTIRATAKDIAGNSKNAVSLNFIVDRTEPSVSNIVLDPVINGNIGNKVIVTFDLTDDTGIDLSESYVIFADGPNTKNQAKESEKLIPIHIEGNRYYVEFDTFKFVKKNYVGKYNLQFTTYDKVGNHSSYKPKEFKQILVDNNGPVATYLMKDQNNVFSGNEIIRFKFEVTDDTGVLPGSGTYMRIRIPEEKKYVLTHEEGNIWYADVDANDIPEGKYQIDVRLVDVFNRSRSSNDKGVFIIDKTSPDLNITLGRTDYVTSGQIVSKISNPEAEVKDINIAKLVIYKEDCTFNNEWTNFNPGGVINYKGIGWLGDGMYKLIAYDKAGNASIPFEIIMDSTAPTATIVKSPINNQGNVLVTLTASEEIQAIEGWEKENATSYTKLYTKNTKETVTFKDIADNNGSIEVNITNINPLVTNISYSTTNPTNLLVTTTLTFSEPVYMPTPGLWFAEKGSNYTKWSTIYYNNIEENITFKNSYGKTNSEAISIKNFDRKLNDAKIEKTVAADKKSVKVTLTADEEVIVYSNGWRKVDGQDGKVWEKTFTRNTFFGELISYRDVAGNYKLTYVTINEIK
ncbi:MAG: Ig-like domain-containing protein [Bacilli bacterium]|nr:Ig-like domain-containing protein [Bacilli bacterium]